MFWFFSSICVFLVVIAFCLASLSLLSLIVPERYKYKGIAQDQAYVLKFSFKLCFVVLALLTVLFFLQQIFNFFIG